MPEITVYGRPGCGQCLATTRDSLREVRERLAALEGRVWSDLAPPGGWVCAVCGVPVESEPCSEHEPPAVRLELAEAWIAHLESAYGIPADARERWMLQRRAGALETPSPSPEPTPDPESRSTGQLGGKADAPVLTVAELERLRRVMLASYGGIEPGPDPEPRLAHYALEPDGGLIDVIDLATTLARRVEELEQRALDSMPAGVDQAGEPEGCSGCAPAPLPPDIESAKARIAELEAALRDFAEHGTRHDLTPTNISSSPEQRRAQLEGYIRSMDASVRTRARTALTQAGETTAPKGELGEVRG